MELQIAGTNLEIPPATQEYIERKLGKLNKHIPDIIDVRVEVSEEKTKSPEARYLVRGMVNSGVGGAVVHGEERAEDIPKAVDKVVAVLKRQLERHKGKIYDRGRGKPLARGKYNTEDETERRVVKTKRFDVEPMLPREAIDQMERLGHNFFLFLDMESEEVRLVYRRNDGDYGMIEPVIKLLD